MNQLIKNFEILSMKSNERINFMNKDTNYSFDNGYWPQLILVDLILITNWNWLGTNDVDQLIRAEGNNYFTVSTLFRSEFLHMANYLAHFDVTVIDKIEVC